MNSAPSPSSLRLTGGGCFLRAIDSETRIHNDASHLSQLHLTLDGPAPLREWKQYLTAVIRSAPFLTAVVSRKGLVGTPQYLFQPRCPADIEDRVRIHETSLSDRVCRAAELSQRAPRARTLNDRVDLREGELFFVDLFRNRGTPRVVFTWAHMLLDGSGSEQLVARLEKGWSRWQAGNPLRELFKPSLEDPLWDVAGAHSLMVRLRRTREWSRFLDETLPTKVASPGGALSGRDQDIQWTRHPHTPDQTEVIRSAARQRTGHLQPMIFYLAVSMRAHHAVLEQRGTEDRALLVPVAVDMRRDGSRPVFRTHASFFWFYAEPGDLHDLDHLIGTLQAQRKRLIKENFHRRTATAMETVRWLPRTLYRRMVRSPFGGQLASFFFSYTGPFLPDQRTFLGARIRGGFHAPSVPPSPGSSLIWNVHREQLQYTHLYQAGVLTSSDRDRLHEKIRRDLLRKNFDRAG